MRKSNHGKGGSRHVGALRIRAAEILSDGLGYHVHPHEIFPVSGMWKRCDVYRWELFTKDQKANFVVLKCWDTLREFVRYASKYGFVVNKDHEIEEVQ